MTEKDARPLKFAVVEYATNKQFANVYDALGIERLEWELVSYDRETRTHRDRAFAYIPVTRCKLLLHKVLTGAAYKPGWKFEVFGGSFHKDGSIESRLFKVEYDPGADNAFARFPFRISIAVGRGKRTATGGIAPDGDPTTSVKMRFPDDDFVGICLEVRDFLREHQREIEQYRRTEQRTRFAERQSGAPASDTTPAHELWNDGPDDQTIDEVPWDAAIDPEELVCHVGTASSGKKLRDLEQVHLEYFASGWQPKTVTTENTTLQQAAKIVLQRRQAAASAAPGANGRQGRAPQRTGRQGGR